MNWKRTLELLEVPLRKYIGCVRCTGSSLSNDMHRKHFSIIMGNVLHMSIWYIEVSGSRCKTSWPSFAVIVISRLLSASVPSPVLYWYQVFL